MRRVDRLPRRDVRVGRMHAVGYRHRLVVVVVHDRGAGADAGERVGGDLGRRRGTCGLADSGRAVSATWITPAGSRRGRLDERDDESNGLRARDAVGRERAPGRERERVADRAREHASAAAGVRTSARPRGRRAAAQRRRGRTRRARHRAARCRASAPCARRRIELVERALETLPRVVDRAPDAEVGPRVRGEVVGGAAATDRPGVGESRSSVRRLRARPLHDAALDFVVAKRARRCRAAGFRPACVIPAVRLGSALAALLQLNSSGFGGG